MLHTTTSNLRCIVFNGTYGLLGICATIWIVILKVTIGIQRLRDQQTESISISNTLEKVACISSTTRSRFKPHLTSASAMASRLNEILQLYLPESMPENYSWNTTSEFVSMHAIAWDKCYIVWLARQFSAHPPTRITILRALVTTRLIRTSDWFEKGTKDLHVKFLSNWTFWEDNAYIPLRKKSAPQ